MSQNLLDQTTRVDLGDGKWVEIRALSVGELRELRSKSFNAVPQDGEEQVEAQGYELTQMALAKGIVGWSDPAPPTPENIARLPYKLTLRIADAIGLGADEAPLADGSVSTST